MPRLLYKKLDPFDFRAFGSFAQGDCSWEVHCSIEALVEISDFVTGLVHRVPKKPNVMKADLLNSTASQDDQLEVLSLDMY